MPAIVLSGVLAAVARPAPGAERAALPAFELRSLDDHAVSGPTVARSGTWLLVYVREHSSHSRALLKVVARKESRLLPERVVVMVGATSDGARRMRQGYASLAHAGWYADAAGAAFAQLDLHGAPSVLGMRGDRIEWTLQGTLPRQKELASLFESWLKPSRP
jgi:hypothetical protein